MKTRKEIKMSKELISCKVCGKEMASNAKTCPNCGAKNKKPIYKRPWFIVICIILVLAIISSFGSSSEEPENVTSSNPSEEQQNVEITYTPYSVDTLMDDLDNNALKAEETYDNQYVEITGELSVIDSDGQYINLIPQNRSFAILGCQCYIKNDEQKQQVIEMSIGQILTIRGKITSVGEVTGYQLDIQEIVE